MRKLVIRGAAILFGAVAAVGLSAVPAAAHVTVSSASATQGGYAKLTFRVPNEKDSAATTQVEVNLPADHPIASVSTKPVPGWTVTSERTRLATPVKTDDREITEAVTKITWKADTAESAIRPGQFQEFDVSAGPLPKVDTLVFKALQTYSDGEVVRWIEVPAAGQEPDRPAPTLKLAPAKDADGIVLGDAGSAAPRADSAGSGGSGGGRANLALGLAIAGLAIAGLAGALAAAGLVLLRRRGPA